MLDEDSTWHYPKENVHCVCWPSEAIYFSPMTMLYEYDQIPLENREKQRERLLFNEDKTCPVFGITRINHVRREFSACISIQVLNLRPIFDPSPDL